jgi:molecular chaperone GrpE
MAAEVDAWKDRHLRLAAEYDNFRKRTAKERLETWQRAQAELIARLADALDDLSRFAHIDPVETDAKTLHEGVELVERKMWRELESAGVTRIDKVGVAFDPNMHEAVTMQPAPKPELDHTVGHVVQPGYKMRDTLLRPARVIVLTWQGGGR